jgi:regulator of cell morphogenesis and NO signaling
MCKAILENQKLLLLFPRFNIRLGFSEMSVEEVCRKNGVNIDFFLEIANAYLEEDYVPQEDLSLFSLDMILKYLTNTHAYYLEVALPGVEEKIHRLLNESVLSGKERELVSRFFHDYKSDFLDHLSREEEVVIPYIRKLEEELLKAQPDADFVAGLEDYSIRDFAQEHDRLEYSLENLSKLIIKNLPPFDDIDLCNQVLRDLTALVKDLIDHANIEDKVMIPRVADLEQRLLRKLGEE